MKGAENLVGVLDFLNRNYDVFYETMKTMDVALLQKWSSVSTDLRKHCQNEFRRRFNVMLQKFVTDVPAASRVMLKTRTVISGSSVLPAIDPGNLWWANDIKDIDFYTCHRFSEEFLDHLMHKEGYVIDLDESRIRDGEVAPANDFHAHYTGNSIRSVYALRRAKDGKRIDVIVSNSAYNSTLPIFQFHSTIVMNFISPVLAFVAYPQYTFAKHGLLNIDTAVDAVGWHFEGPWNVKPKIRRILEKYRDRGFTLAYTPWAWDDKHNVNCRFGGDCTGVRRTNDGQCLVFPFGMTTSFDKGVSYFWDGMLPGGHVEWTLGGVDCIKVNSHDADIVYPSICYPIPG